MLEGKKNKGKGDIALSHRRGERGKGGGRGSSRLKGPQQKENDQLLKQVREGERKRRGVSGLTLNFGGKGKRGGKKTGPLTQKVAAVLLVLKTRPKRKEGV